jgi:hypothetical protein
VTARPCLSVSHLALSDRAPPCLDRQASPCRSQPLPNAPRQSAPRPPRQFSPRTFPAMPSLFNPVRDRRILPCLTTTAYPRRSMPSPARSVRVAPVPTATASPSLTSPGHVSPHPVSTAHGPASTALSRRTFTVRPRPNRDRRSVPSLSRPDLIPPNRNRHAGP